MPVKRGRAGLQGGLRSALLVGVAGVVVAVALVLGILWLARSGGDVEIRLGDRDFRNLDAERISAEIAERGPVLFSDVAGGERDLIVSHVGDDPASGWTAFDARRPGQPRDCWFRPQPVGGSRQPQLVSTCDPDDVVDSAGTGLTQYPVTIDDGSLRIDINSPIPP